VPEKIKDATMGASIGRTIRESVEDPDAVLASLKQSKPTEFQTAAEVAQSQGLSSLEDAVRAKGGELLNSLPEARSTARLDRATGNAAEISNYDRSKELERVLGRSVDQVEELEKAKWKLLPKDEKLIGDHLNADLSKQIAEITLDGAIPLSGTSAGLIKRWSDLSKEVISVDQLQAFRSKVLEESRAAKKLMQRNPTEDARNTVRITDTLLKHIDDVVDTNISAGLTTSETASVWSAARQATRNKYEAFLPQSGPKSQAAKAAFYGDEMKDAAAIQEGLRSPDVMMAQIKAAEAGGQDVRSIYQEALKAELASRPQSKWADFIEDRRLQFDLAFESNPQALSQINLALQDIASESRKYTRAKSAFGTNSSTFTRQAINERIDRNKGIAALGGAAVPAISGTYGAVEGWSSGDTIADKAARALLFGAGGAVAGKAYRGLASRASDSFDEGLALALRDPAIAARRLEQSKPTKFSEILGQVIREARPQATARGAGLVSNSIFGSGEKFQSLPQQIQQEENSSQNLSQGDLQRFLASPETVPNDSIQREEGETSADPTSLFNLSKSDLDMTPRDIDPLLKQAVIWQESRGNPNAVSKKGATGIMQIMPGTAREIAQELGIEEYDLRDPATNEMFGEYYLGKMLDQFDGDVELALTAYNQGPNRVKRLLERNNGSTLADIIDDLGPDGRSYAKLILGRYAKLKNESEQV
jgi:soluble lytic murein transglycosylase-like protein